MPIHDLTPQLRTRLGRVERVVGLFVVLATALLLLVFSITRIILRSAKDGFC